MYPFAQFAPKITTIYDKERKPIGAFVDPKAAHLLTAKVRVS